MTSLRRLSADQIAAARAEIDPVFLSSPQFVAESLGAELGATLIVKVETANPIRSFKGRGADLFMRRHAARTGCAPVICASAGNFGQGMAYAARTHGVDLTVFAAVSANPFKLARMAALGATVERVGDDFDAAKVAARDEAERRGVLFVEDSRDLEPTIGAGTIGAELASESLDAVLVPLGNGALLAGIGCWFAEHHPQVQVIGVCAAGAPAMEQSWRSGTLVTHDAIDTIADGIGVRTPVPEALVDLAGLVDDIVLVDDASIIAAMTSIHQHVGIVTEPSGAVGVAAIAKDRERFDGMRVATILCGGNLTADQMAAWL